VYLKDLDSLEGSLRRLDAMAESAPADTMRRVFGVARASYKRLEYLVGYRAPDLVVALDGAPLPRVDDHVRGGVLPPTGLQVIEAALFPERAPDAAAIVHAQRRRMTPALRRLRTERLIASAADPEIFDAMRQELARIAVVGLAGFDATRSGNAILESAEALRGVRDGAAAYRPRRPGAALTRWTTLDSALAAGMAYLESHPGFDQLDRLRFITAFEQPISRALDRLQQSLGIARVGRTHSWSARASTIFADSALDPFLYAPSDARSDPEVVAIGRRLFLDPILSRGRTRSCATCHEPARAFTDGRKLAAVDPGRGQVRNTPTLLAASLQPFQFADQRAQSLEDQVAVVLENPREMGLPLPAATARLRADSAYRRGFATAFRAPPGRAVSERRIQLALAAYVRTLRGTTSRFDIAVRGDSTALTPSERRGFNLFMGKGACATCHFPPLFGGTLPPSLLEAEPEVIGVPSRPVIRNAVVDPDPGVAAKDGEAPHLHAFKTPTLRNIALTAPYMHNGVYRTLEEVVDFYDRGSGGGIGVRLPNLTLSPEPLHLTRAEKRDLVSFLSALTDTAYASTAR
jgi:cytochrome c peroxidase